MFACYIIPNCLAKRKKKHLFFLQYQHKYKIYKIYQQLSTVYANTKTNYRDWFTNEMRASLGHTPPLRRMYFLLLRITVKAQNSVICSGRWSTWGAAPPARTICSAMHCALCDTNRSLAGLSPPHKHVTTTQGPNWPVLCALPPCDTSESALASGFLSRANQDRGPKTRSTQKLWRWAPGEPWLLEGSTHRLSADLEGPTHPPKIFQHQPPLVIPVP